MKSQQSRRTSRRAKREAEQQAQLQTHRRLIQAGIGLGLVLVVGAIAVIVITNSNSRTLSCIGVKDPDSSVPAGGSQKQWSAPQQVIDTGHTYCAILKTNQGRIVIELYPKSAPKNVNSFVFLAQQGFYDNITWHRVLADFVAQTGDPQGTGMGGPGYTVPLEIDPNLKYDQAGRVGVARSQAPDSAGSQFFIAYKALPSLNPHSAEMPDSAGYTIIGQVVEGMDVVRAITLRDPDQGATAPGDPLLSVRVVDLTAGK
jgi:cyclophilin family peptidyl-prolyl cis-trans isomerase